MAYKSYKTYETYLKRGELKVLFLIVVVLGLVAVAVAFFNLGVSAERQYQQLLDLQ